MGSCLPIVCREIHTINVESDSFPRELLSTTLSPVATAKRAIVIPIGPLPIIPIDRNIILPLLAFFQIPFFYNLSVEAVTFFRIGLPFAGSNQAVQTIVDIVAPRIMTNLITFIFGN